MAVCRHGDCVRGSGYGYELHVFERSDDLREELWQGETQGVGTGPADCGIWAEWDVAESDRESFFCPKGG